MLNVKRNIVKPEHHGTTILGCVIIMLTPERQIQSNGSTVLYSLSCDCAILVSVLWNTPPEHRSLMLLMMM